MYYETPTIQSQIWHIYMCGCSSSVHKTCHSDRNDQLSSFQPLPVRRADKSPYSIHSRQETTSCNHGRSHKVYLTESRDRLLLHSTPQTCGTILLQVYVPMETWCYNMKHRGRNGKLSAGSVKNSKICLITFELDSIIKKRIEPFEIWHVMTLWQIGLIYI